MNRFEVTKNIDAANKLTAITVVGVVQADDLIHILEDFYSRLLQG